MVILPDPTSGSWLRLSRPATVLSAREAGAVPSVIRDVEALVARHEWHAAGFLTYEAAGAFGLATHPPPRALPVAWFGLFPKAHVERLDALPPGSYTLGAPSPVVTREVFVERVRRIKEHILDGETYQVNYTFALEASFSGDPCGLFVDLLQAQAGRHAAFIDLGDRVICSASPELFFARAGDRLVARPMKGTARRGRTLDEDRVCAGALQASPKDRAENVMIVDMIRNDLGRVAVTGSVRASALYQAERYPTVWQLTSTVEARSRAPLADVFAALHPSASVTGAPKVRTMEIVRTLEPEARGVYCGAIGHVRPDGDAWFNVAIRTAIVDRAAGRVRFGVGAGIVWDSEPDREYDECLLKGAVLGRRPVAFELLETLRWQDRDGYALLDRHLARMAASAEYFGWHWPGEVVRAALADAVRGGPPSPARVRLLLAQDGTARTEVLPLGGDDEAAVRIGLARTPVDPDDVFLYHKTTNRRVHDRARAERPDCDEAVLWNTRGEVTEAVNWNVVVDRGGQRVTPPVSCGLLGGTFRAELLERGEVREAAVGVDELRAAPRVWLVNSVRGWRHARLADGEGASRE